MNKINPNNNNNNVTNSREKGNSNFIYTLLSASVILLIVIFLYYEFYYIPSKTTQFTDYKILLDKSNNKGISYLFHQKFGSGSNGIVVIDKGIKVDNLDSFIEYNTIDEFDCNSSLTNVTISMKLKLPHVAPNKKWHSSFRKDKNIIQFGSSPIICYQPIHDKILLRILYKDNPNRIITDTIELDGIIENWMNIIYVIQNRNVSVYLNNKLIKSHILKGVPILNFNNKTLVKIGDYNNNFNGLVDNITLYEKVLTNEEIKKM